MAKWMIEGSLIASNGDSKGPPSISEPFLTEEGARSFAAMLMKRGYAVTVRTAAAAGDTRTIAGADLVKWLNAGPF